MEVSKRYCEYSRVNGILRCTEEDAFDAEVTGCIGW